MAAMLNDQPKRSRGMAWIVGAALFLLPVLYVLSYPAFERAHFTARITDKRGDALAPLYVPAHRFIRWSSENSDAAKAFFVWYLDQFGVYWLVIDQDYPRR
jgi:hypothetical protein